MLQTRRMCPVSVLVWVFLLFCSDFISNGRQSNHCQAGAWVYTPLYHFGNRYNSGRTCSKLLSPMVISTIRIRKKQMSRHPFAGGADSQQNKSYEEKKEMERMRPIRRKVLKSIITSLATVSSLETFMVSPQPANSAMYDNGPVFEEGTEQVKLPSGVKYVDLRVGTGDDVVERKRVNIQWSLKRSNGYFVDSSAQNDGVPFIFTVGAKAGDNSGDSAAIEGLDEGIRGMKVGGIRRILIPPDLAYVQGVEDGKPGPIPAGFGPKQRIRRVMELLKDIPGEYIVVDVKATRVQ